MDIREIKDRLNRQVEAVCAELLPSGKRIGHEYVYDPGSGKIKVHMTGAKVGVWAHWGGEGSGDIIDLWRTQRGLTLSKALVEIKTWLGIEEPTFTGPSRRQYQRPAQPQTARPAKPGTEVEIYLRGERAISREIIKMFMIGQADVYLSEEGRRVEGPWILFPYIRISGAKNELINMKWLHVDRRPSETGGKPKKRIIQAIGAEPCLFGWQAIDDSARAVIICEGEIDVLTWRHYGYLALGVPAGAGVGHKNDWIDTEWDRLDRFEELLISLDQDDEGKKGTADIVTRLGAHRCRVIALPHNDINECLAKHGMTAEDIAPFVSGAKSMSPEELRSARFFVEQVLDEFYPSDDLAAGYELPFRRMKDFRFRMGETTTVTGINGHGKANCIDTQVLTDGGFRKIRDIQTGDYVFDEQGRLTKVIAVSETMFDRPCFKITFNDGASVICDAEHQWLTTDALARRSARYARKNGRESGLVLKSRGTDQTHKRRWPAVVTTGQIARTLFHTMPNGARQKNHAVPIAGPIQRLRRDLPIDPYVFGCWLGNGASSGAAITHGDQDAEHYACEFEIAGFPLHPYRDGKSHGIGGGRGIFRGYLRGLNVLGNKHIPEIYRAASAPQRLALLQGLFDTDGHITAYGRCEFCSVRLGLADQVLELALSLGILPKLIEGRATIDGVDKGPKYRITFTTTQPVFRLARKFVLLPKTVSTRATHRFISSCEPVESVPVKCIQVANPSGLFLCTEALIPTHNSAIVSQVALWLVEHGARCMVASMEMRPSKTLERMTRQVAGELKPSVDHIRAIFDWYDNRVWVYNVHGSTQVDRLLEVMLYARRRFGVNVFVIDSLMRCGISFEDYEAQDGFVRRLCAFDETEMTHTILIAHSRKGQDEKTPVGKLDIKGSGGITDNAFNCLSIWRNKPKEIKLQEVREDRALGTLKRMEKEADLLAKPDAILICDKQRHGTGWEGRVRLWFNPQTVLYRDIQTEAKMELHSAPEAEDHPIEF